MITPSCLPALLHCKTQHWVSVSSGDVTAASTTAELESWCLKNWAEKWTPNMIGGNTGAQRAGPQRDFREIRGKYLWGTVFHYIYSTGGATWTLPLRGYHQVGKTGIKSLKQSNPKCTVCQRRVPDGLGRWHKGLEGQLIIPDATWSVGGKPRVVSKPMYCYASHFFLICFVIIFVKFLLP